MGTKKRGDAAGSLDRACHGVFLNNFQASHARTENQARTIDIHFVLAKAGHFKGLFDGVYLIDDITAHVPGIMSGKIGRGIELFDLAGELDGIVFRVKALNG